ncbi:terminase small subunit [Heyndrickxia sp. FSL W8-0496]|uniref:terminase small subunit n=1 Tax=Heyndrickxia sp. FSL W8-0496 TaxID=2954702 RepID=UPI0030F9E25E
MKLTEKQKRFADYYIESGNATDAYRKAYNASDKTASVEGFKNLAKPSVKKYIEERMSEIRSKNIATQEEILEYLTSVMRGEISEEVAVATKKGVSIVDVEVGAKDRTKAAELLGKRYAMWTDNKNIGGNIGVTIVDDIDD